MLGPRSGSVFRSLASALQAVRSPLRSALRALGRSDPEGELGEPFQRAWDQLDYLFSEVNGERKLLLFALDIATATQARGFLQPYANEVGIPIVDGSNSDESSASDIAVFAVGTEFARAPEAVELWNTLLKRFPRAQLLYLDEGSPAATDLAFPPLEILHAACGRDGAKRLIHAAGPTFPMERIHATLDELLDACLKPEVARHAECWRRFEPVLREESRLRRAVAALSTTDDREWGNAFAEFEHRLIAANTAHLPSLIEEAAAGWREALDEWFQNDASLADLISNSLLPLEEAIQERVWTGVRQTLLTETGSGDAAAWFPRSMRTAFQQAEVRLATWTDRAARATPVLSVLRPAEALLSPNEIPLRPNLSFARLLRGEAAVRERIFGSAEAPRAELLQADKVRWLSGEAQASMESKVIERLNEFAYGRLERSAKRLTGLLASQLGRTLRQKVRAKTRRLDSELSSVEKLFTDPDDLGRHLSLLEETILSARTNLTALTRPDHPVSVTI